VKKEIKEEYEQIHESGHISTDSDDQQLTLMKMYRLAGNNSGFEDRFKEYKKRAEKQL